MKTTFLFVVLIFLLSSCWPELLLKDRNGKFLDEVVRLDEFNSEYDDYNSDMPRNKSGLTHLLFSSKRAKKDYFNLVYYPAEFTYEDRLGLKIYEKKAGISYDYFTTYGAAATLASRVNGNFNVLGPKTVSFNNDFNSYGKAANDLVLFYADDSEGNLQIKYIRNGSNDGPKTLDILNSKKDDAYPSFSYSGDKIYFCSNRDGNFDIYEVTIPRTDQEVITLESLVNPQAFTLRKVQELSSPYEDKCPYLYDDTLVFVSDRPGGKGGFDVYYSRLKDGKFSDPVNAGGRINTEFNEYRPLLPFLDSFNYKLMIFSSDRPGGKGGYDLYMTGLDKTN